METLRLRNLFLQKLKVLSLTHLMCFLSINYVGIRLITFSPKCLHHLYIGFSNELNINIVWLRTFIIHVSAISICMQHYIIVYSWELFIIHFCNKVCNILNVLNEFKNSFLNLFPLWLWGLWAKENSPFHKKKKKKNLAVIRFSFYVMNIIV